MKWTHDPPRITGWWFIGQKSRKSFRHMIVEVRECRRKFEWSFLDGLTWNDCSENPRNFWAGPIVAPSRPTKDELEKAL